MKEKVIKNKEIPWYARYTRWVYDVVLGRTGKVIVAIVFILASLISYGVMKHKPITPYEETYDIEFKDYVNAKFDYLANTVFDEEAGIEFEHIPETVLEYSITWKAESANFSCVLSTDKVISEYNMETGKKPFLSYDEDEFKIDIEITKDFQIINKLSSIGKPPTYEEYEQKIYPLQLVIYPFLYGLLAVVCLYGIVFFISISAIIPEIVTEGWREKYPDEYDEYFHNNN